MKRFLLPLALCALAAATFVRADVEFLELPVVPDPEVSSATIPTGIDLGGRLSLVSFVKGVGSDVGTPSVYVVRDVWTNAVEISSFAETNVSYTVVWSNDVRSVTNTSARPFSPLPATATAYWTNETVRVWAETNAFRAFSCSATNSFDCSEDGWSYSEDAASLSETTPTNVWLLPGDRVFLLWSSDNAPDNSCRATFVLER